MAVAIGHGGGTSRRVGEGLLSTLVAFGDRLVPKRDAVVVRAGQDFDDQSRQVVEALERLGERRVTLLVSGDTDPGPAGPVPCPVVRARSLRGIRAYWQARVVVHTHGAFGSRRASARKTFVNVWHGMPIKRLEPDSDVGRHQTDLTIATSPLHAVHLAETWGLAPEQVAVVGLPRNDLLRAADAPRPAALAALAGDRPLVVWLPTFRAHAGEERSLDGIDEDTVTQFRGASPEAVDAVFARLGMHAIVKPHPLATPAGRAHHPNVDVWTDDDLRAAGLTLYELLAHADYLITDHSSVWVDFLLRDRPVIFAISDLDQYRETRGFYFSSIEELLPGPLVACLEDLEAAFVAFAAGEDHWRDRRRAALDLHHTHQDAASADRVARLVVDRLGDGASQA